MGSKFRFPLPPKLKESQLQQTDSSTLTDFEERVCHVVSRVVPKESLIVTKSTKTRKKKKNHLELADELKTELSSEDVYVRTKKNLKDETEISSIRAKTETLLLSDERQKELDSLTVGAQKSDLAPKVGKRKMKKLKREEREKTKGPGWFGMKAQEMTEEQKRDLQVLRMRSALDPKRFYKKNDHKGLPKFFQIGQVLDSAADFYSDRIPKKQRKKTLVDELMADAEFRKYNKRKYVEIIEEEKKKTKKYYAKKKKKSVRS